VTPKWYGTTRRNRKTISWCKHRGSLLSRHFRAHESTCCSPARSMSASHDSARNLTQQMSIPCKHAHTCSLATRTYVRAHTHAIAHACARAHTHMHARTHTHTHTHTQDWTREEPPSPRSSYTCPPVVTASPSLSNYCNHCNHRNHCNHCNHCTDHLSLSFRYTRPRVVR
jgi:hypothetical protein